MYFESHAHYNDKRYNIDRNELLNRLNEECIDCIINVGASMGSSLDSVRLSQQYDFIYAAVGVHPHDVKDVRPGDIEELKRLTKFEKTVAVGEIGLDYYYDYSDREMQKHYFKKQLELANEVDLPVIIHSREAAQDTFEIIGYSKVRRGVIHCYSGSKEMAHDYIDMGFYLGIGGVVTFKNAKILIDVVDSVPIERILLETDCPYLTPEPFRGERNDSAKLKYVADKIARIKNITTEEVVRITNINAKSLFKIRA
jgi:TatD DNase family protein